MEAALHSLDEFNRHESTPQRCRFDAELMLNSHRMIAREWGHHEQT
jgi:hypothetical protein